MFNLTVCFSNILWVWLWGDWRNWEKYHSTILYLILCDLLYAYLCYNHPLWEFITPVPFLNHTMMDLLVSFISYPCAMLIYLGRFPKKRMRQILWGGLWVGAWSFLEWISLQLGEFVYHNGWNLAWTVTLNTALFLMVRLHYKRPLLTYALSVVATITLLVIFNVPFSKMK